MATKLLVGREAPRRHRPWRPPPPVRPRSEPPSPLRSPVPPALAPSLRMSHAEVAALRAELASIRDQNAKLVQDREQDALKISALQAALETSASPRLSPPPPVAGNLQRMVSANVPTEFGAFEVILFRKEDADAKLDRDGELALVYGGVERVHQDGKTTGQGALVRVHSSCFTGDVLSSKRCDCGEQLQESMRMVAKHGSGIVLYLHQEGRGIGLMEKLKAYNLQDEGLDTVDANLAHGHQADARSYEVAAGMLQDLGVDRIRLMTNNPAKVSELANAGIEVVSRVPIVPEKVTRDNFRYLQTKAARMNHMLGDRFSADATEAVEGGSKSISSPGGSPGKNNLPQDRPAVLYSSTPPYAVVDVNELWLTTCGFQREEVIGKTMRIIQGPLTDGKEVDRMMDTIFLASNPSALTVAGESGDDPASKYAPPSAKMRDETTESGKQPATATLINYTKDRTAFVNEVAVLPRYASSTASFDVTTPPFLSPSPCRTSPTAETLGVFIGGMGQGAEDKGEEWGVFTKTPNRSFSSVFVDDFGRSSCPFAKPDRAHDSHESQ